MVARQRRRAFCGGILVALLIACSAFVGASESQRPPAVSLEQVVTNVQRTFANWPDRMGFRQDVELRALLLKWYFYSDVEREGQAFRIRTHGAPSFIPDDLSANLVDLSQSFGQFELRLADQQQTASGDIVYVLEGQRRPEIWHGPTRGRMWINGRTWHVERVVAHYPWGTLTVDQAYDVVEGYVVLARQEARVSPLAAQLRIAYRDYWFDRP